MRIGFFTAIDGWGGSEVYLRSMILGVRARGHEPVLFGVSGTRLYNEIKQAGVECVAWKNAESVFASLRRDKCGTRNLEGGGGEGIPCASIRPLNRGKTVLLGLIPTWLKLLAGNMCEAAKLTHLFHEHRVDVMHVNVNGYETAGPACRCAGILSLAVYHNTFISEGYWFRRWLIRRNIRSYSHVCFVAPRSRDAWERGTGIGRARTSAIWNGVDVDRFHPRDRSYRQSASETLKIVSVGRLSYVKGYRFLLEAMHSLGDNRVRLELIGEGEQEGELRELAQGLSLDGCVTLVGNSERPEDYLRSADVFVLASVAHESCPLVIPEAMACGLPLITSDFGALPDMNIDGDTGLVVPAGDSAALAEAIRRLADDPELAAAMGDTARKRAVSTFSLDRMIRDTLDLYESLCSAADRNIKQKEARDGASRE